MTPQEERKREWKRVERRIWMEDVGWPLIAMVSTAIIMTLGLIFFHNFTRAFCALIAVIGLPLLMLMGKKSRDKK